MSLRALFQVSVTLRVASKQSGPDKPEFRTTAVKTRGSKCPGDQRYFSPGPNLLSFLQPIPFMPLWLLFTPCKRAMH